MLKFALLALLAQRPRHGYELKTGFDAALPGQPVNIGQVYATLQRLEQAGLVCSEQHEGDGRERTVYTLLETGRESLLEWLAEPIEPGTRLRDEFAVKLLISHLAGGADSAALIRAQRHAYLQWLSELSKRRARLPDDVPPFTELLLDYAIRHTKADLEWLDECELRLGSTH